MGPDVAVMDHFTFTIDSKDFIMSDASTKDEGATPGAGGMTLQDAIKMLGELAPQVAKLTQAMGAMGGGATTPAAGAVEDTTTATPAAAASDAEPAVKPAEVAAMDARLKSVVTEFADFKANGTRALMKEIAVRDVLVARLTPHVGTFDHAEKTLQDVAVYGCEKLGIKVAADAALPALEGYLTAAPALVAAAKARIGMDAANGPSSLVDGYLTGTASK